MSRPASSPASRAVRSPSTGASLWTQALVATAKGFGITSIAANNLQFDIAVGGAADAQTITGRPAPLNIDLNSGGGFHAGPYTSTLTGVGDSGAIRYTTSNIKLTIVVTLGGASDGEHDVQHR